MSKIWIWTKIIFFSLLFIYIIIFCSTNYAHEAKVWVWINKTAESTVLTVAGGSFLFGVIVTLFVRTTLLTLRQLKDLQERKRGQRLQRDMDDMKAKAAMLQPKTTGSLPDDNSAKT
jgi:hypothetical protein